MNLKRFIPLCSLLVIDNRSSKKCTHHKDDSNFNSKTDKAAKLIKIFKEKCGIPGISVQINIGNNIKLSYSYGYSDVENLIKCKGDSLMRIASISKSFTSIIAAKLIDEGLLDLDLNINNYIKFPTKYVDSEQVVITCRQLLSHRSGIRHYKKEGDGVEYSLTEFLSTKRCCKVEEGLNVFDNDNLEHKPGTKFLYTTYGYVLLGAILEKIAQKSSFFSVDNKLKNNNQVTLENMYGKVSDWLRLKNTHCEYHENILLNRSRQYRRISSRECVLQVAPYVDNSCKWSGGGLVSTCEDLNEFAQHLVSIWMGQISPADSVISRNVLAQLWTEQHQESEGKWLFGLGWTIRREPGRFIVCHTGGACGGISVLLINLPEQSPPNEGQHVIVSILCNLENAHGSIGDLALELSRLFS